MGTRIGIARTFQRFLGTRFLALAEIPVRMYQIESTEFSTGQSRFPSTFSLPINPLETYS
jgi:hypothetical protein